MIHPQNPHISPLFLRQNATHRIEAHNASLICLTTYRFQRARIINYVLNRSIKSVESKAVSVIKNKKNFGLWKTPQKAGASAKSLPKPSKIKAGASGSRSHGVQLPQKEKPPAGPWWASRRIYWRWTAGSVRVKSYCTGGVSAGCSSQKRSFIEPAGFERSTLRFDFF